MRSMRSAGGQSRIVEAHHASAHNLPRNHRWTPRDPSISVGWCIRTDRLTDLPDTFRRPRPSDPSHGRVGFEIIRLPIGLDVPDGRFHIDVHPPHTTSASDIVAHLAAVTNEEIDERPGNREGTRFPPRPPRARDCHHDRTSGASACKDRSRTRNKTRKRGRSG